MTDPFVAHMARAFEDELVKIAGVSINASGASVKIPAELGKMLAVGAVAAVAALGLRNAARDNKMGRLQRLNDELQAGDVWF